MVGARRATIPESEAFRTRHEVPRVKKETRDETYHHVTRLMWTVAYRWRKRKSSSVIFDLYRANVKSTVSNSKLKTADRSFANTALWITRFEKNGINKKMRVAVKYWKWKTDRYAEIGEFSVCLCSFIIEDSCCNGLADDVFPSPVSSGPHCTKTNLQRSENRSRKVRFHELSGLFLLFTVEPEEVRHAPNCIMGSYFNVFQFRSVQNADCRLQTADCRPGTKWRLGTKCRLQTAY